jgi:RNA recognition motif-containing protein
MKSGIDPTDCLFVGDLSVCYNEQLLYELFSPFGKINSIEVRVKNKDQKSIAGFCFIYFSTIDEATEAKEKLNGNFKFGRRLR